MLIGRVLFEKNRLPASTLEEEGWPKRKLGLLEEMTGDIAVLQFSLTVCSAVKFPAPKLL